MSSDDSDDFDYAPLGRFCSLPSSSHPVKTSTPQKNNSTATPLGPKKKSQARNYTKKKPGPLSSSLPSFNTSSSQPAKSRSFQRNKSTATPIIPKRKGKARSNSKVKKESGQGAHRLSLEENKSTVRGAINVTDCWTKEFLKGHSVFGTGVPPQPAHVAEKRKSSECNDEELLVCKREMMELNVCPLCMFPWKEYDDIGKDRQLHTNKCLDVDLGDKPECEEGITCHEICEYHFWAFKHDKLAKLHSLHRWDHGESESENCDSKKKTKRHSPGADSGCEDVKMAGASWPQPSSALTDVVNLETSDEETNYDSNSVQLFTINSGSMCNEGSTVLKGSSLKNTPTERISTNFSGFGQQGYKVNTVTAMKKDSGNIANNGIIDSDELPDLSIDPVSQMKRGSCGGDQTKVVVSEVPSTQKTEALATVDDDYSQNTEYYHDETQTTINYPGNTKICDRSSTHEPVRDQHDGDSTCSYDAARSSSASLQSESLLKPVSPGGSGIHNTRQPDVTRRKDNSASSNINAPEKIDVCEPHPNEPHTSGMQGRGNSFDGLEDSEDDELFSKYVDAAVEKYMSRNYIEQQLSGTTQANVLHCPTHEEGQQAKSSSFPCIHVHLHLGNVPEKSQRKDGQTSILQFFSSTNQRKSGCPQTINKCSPNCKCLCKECKHASSKPAAASSKPAAESWKALMSRMKGNRVKIPSVSQSSGSTVSLKEDCSGTQQQQNKATAWQPRKCPFYKFIPGTTIVVDAFCYGYLEGISGYFLTHFHYDHYRGLKKSFNRPIYCSEITANLVSVRIGVADQFLHRLPMSSPQVVCGLEVTLLDANHCPGAVMFLFKLKTGATVLHVGDFRAHPKMESYPALWNCLVDTLYLDTTYCNPIYDFPSQEDVIEKCVSIAKSHVDDNPKTLIVVGSYSIGKERVFKAIASALDCRIWASKDKQKTLHCIQDEEIQARLTSDKHSARIHVLPMNDLKPKKLIDYVETLKPHYQVAVSIRPTGWEHSGEGLDNLTPNRYGNICMYGISYSEHSSYAELRRFVQFFQPKKVIPTVNIGSPATRKMMEKTFDTWLKKPQKDNSIKRMLKK